MHEHVWAYITYLECKMQWRKADAIYCNLMRQIDPKSPMLPENN